MQPYHSPKKLNDTIQQCPSFRPLLKMKIREMSKKYSKDEENQEFLGFSTTAQAQYDVFDSESKRMH